MLQHWQTLLTSQVKLDMYGLTCLLVNKYSTFNYIMLRTTDASSWKLCHDIRKVLLTLTRPLITSVDVHTSGWLIYLYNVQPQQHYDEKTERCLFPLKQDAVFHGSSNPNKVAFCASNRKLSP